jgi:diguanylate cyclase (GGDEF)-like protein
MSSSSKRTTKSGLMLSKTGDLLCVLLIECRLDDAGRVQALLKASENVDFTIDLVMNVDEAHRALVDEIYDVILVADEIEGWTGVELITAMSHADPFLPPVIMLAREDDREADLAAQEAGVADYLIKGQLTPPLLERSIRYALERKQSEQRLLRLAFYDTLTGLPNRASFKREIDDRIIGSCLTKEKFSLLLLDLDHFKKVNDTLGHPVGDLLLQAVSQRLTSTVDEGDFVARLGGDEFVICTHSYRIRSEVEQLAVTIVENIREPYLLENHPIRTATSIGIATYPRDGETYPELLKHADLALYRAKDRGRGTYIFYTDDLTATTVHTV